MAAGFELMLKSMGFSADDIKAKLADAVKSAMPEIQAKFAEVQVNAANFVNHVEERFTQILESNRRIETKLDAIQAQLSQKLESKQEATHV